MSACAQRIYATQHEERERWWLFIHLCLLIVNKQSVLGMRHELIHQYDGQVVNDRIDDFLLIEGKVECPSGCVYQMYLDVTRQLVLFDKREKIRDKQTVHHTQKGQKGEDDRR
jgi:hypothetical protein